MNREIQRLQNISKSEFQKKFSKGGGTPVIVTDAVQKWPASAKWSFEYFKRKYGEDFIHARLNHQGAHLKLTKLSAYIDYLDQPENEPAGFWCTSDLQIIKDPPKFNRSDFLYLLDWCGFRRHGELYDDVGPWYFISDWTNVPMIAKWLPRLHGYNYWSLYMGPAGTLFPLHRDFGHTIGSLTQISGTKSVTLFSPRDSRYLYDGLVDIEAPDLNKFPLFQQATPLTCSLKPGETLVIPPNWWHQVRATDKSITISHNFLNHMNAHTHITDALMSGFKQFKRTMHQRLHNRFNRR